MVGLLADYKDKDGNITKWGRRALIGVISSTLIAAISQGFEAYKQNEDAKAANERNYKLLTDLGRAAYPILENKDMILEASVEIPLDDESLKDYRSRLDEGVEKFKKAGKSSLENGALEAFMNENSGVRTLIGLTISANASLFPKRDNERVAWKVFAEFGIEADLYKNPIALDRSSGRQDEDLHFRANTDTSKMTLEYQLQEQRILIHSKKMVVTNEDDFRPTNKILSLPDLAGSQMFITFKDQDSGDDNLDMNYIKIMRNADLKWVKLKIANRQFFISHFTKLPNTTYPIYVYTLPDNLMEADVNLP